MIEFLQRNKFPLKDEYFYNLMQLDKSALNPGKIDWAPDETAMPFVPPGKANPKGPKGQEAANQKKKQQETQQRNNPPTGV